MNNNYFINKIKKKYSDKMKSKIITIPTEKELYNIIINIFIYNVLILNIKYNNINDTIKDFNIFIRYNTIKICYMILTNEYNFRLYELIQYIIKLNRKTAQNTSILYIYNELINNPLKCYNTIKTQAQAQAATPNIYDFINEILKYKFYIKASNKAIDGSQSNKTILLYDIQYNP